VRTSLVLVAVLVAARVDAQPAPAGAPGTAEARARAKDLYTAGTRQYDLREYAAAIDTFRKAYDLLPEPLFLFDIAQSYRQLHDCENARGFYKSYLRNLPRADNRDKVERFIAEMDTCVREQEQQRALQRERQPPAPISGPAPNAGSRHRDLAIGGIVTAVAGLAAGGAGAYFSVDASNQARKLETLCECGCDGADVADVDQRGRRSDRAAIGLYVLGGAAFGAGIGMVLWAALHNDESVIVTPSSGGVTVSAMGRF